MKKEERKNNNVTNSNVIEIGDTITWKGVNRIEKGVVEQINYNGGKAVSFLARTGKGYVPVAAASVRMNEVEDEQ